MPQVLDHHGQRCRRSAALGPTGRDDRPRIEDVRQIDVREPPAAPGVRHGGLVEHRPGDRAHSAAKRGISVTDLRVEVTGYDDGPRFTAFRIVVHTDVPPGAKLDAVIAAARRVCYVTRTLANPPEIDVVLG
ncbi:MAG TPA: OsmC family protein [Pseudonocardia sp.]|nr:OsmC family protein [Pseudonocardia sp.]